jgi:DNA-directed RNA polymerase subunit RPC12/RpoP
MADDEIRKLEAVLGAISNITSERDESALVGVRCPKCGWTGFAKVETLHDAAVARLEDGADGASAVREGGLSDRELVRRLAPPRRKSATTPTVILAVLLGAAAVYVYRRFGELPAEFAGIAAFVLVLMFFLTRTRATGDTYYTAMRSWRRQYACRKCGQVVET